MSHDVPEWMHSAGEEFYFCLHCLDHLSETAKGVGFAFSVGVSSRERLPMMPAAFGKLCKALPHTCCQLLGLASSLTHLYVCFIFHNECQDKPASLAVFNPLTPTLLPICEQLCELLSIKSLEMWQIWTYQPWNDRISALVEQRSDKMHS